APTRFGAWVVALIGDERHAQGQRLFRRRRLRQEPPGRIDAMSARLHPDARLDAVVADFVAPNRGRVVEVKTADANVARRGDGAALPSVGEQRPGARTRDHGCIGFGEDQPAAQRRCDRRDQQSMIAPGQAPGDGTTRGAAEAVGEPPFASLGLSEIAAYGAGESDRRWDRSGATLRPDLRAWLRRRLHGAAPISRLSRLQGEGAAQRRHLGAASNVEKAARKPEILEERPEVLSPSVAVEWKSPEIV